MDVTASTAARPEAAREVSCAILIGTCGRLLLQQRDDVPHIIHPGMIGLFGGHRDPGEGALDCLLREIEEEIGVRIEPERAELFLDLFVKVEQPPMVLDIAIYVIRGIPFERVVVTEGSPLITDVSGLAALYQRMTPTTAFTLRQLELQMANLAGSPAQRQAMRAQQQ